MNLIPTAYAQSASSGTITASGLIHNINKFLINPAIILMFAIALVFFLYGVFQFLSNADKADERELGQQHMIWGVIGMVIMIGAFGILKILENTLGVQHSQQIP